MPSIYTQSAEERQRAYEAVGLRSWEIAKWEAEVSGQKKKEAMSELERTVGAPERVGIQGQLREFTLPSGVRQTFTEAGDQTSLQLPLNLTNDFAPQDRKKIEKLYQARSKFATDPELTPQERQFGMDKVDAQISRVPHISPMMKEPTAQQKFNASIVTAPDGMKGTFEPKTGKFIPLESSKAKQELETERRKRKQTFLTGIMKANDAAVENDEPPRSFESMNAEAEMQSQIEAGLVEPAGKMNPKLDSTWQVYKSELDNQLNSKGRATEKQMFTLMDRYVEYANLMSGISPDEAKYDFLKRWQKAIGDGDEIVAKMSPQTQRRMWSVAANTIDPQGAIRGSIPISGGLKRGEGTVTKDGKTVSTGFLPPGLESIWPSLDADDKTAIRKKLDEGWTAQEILTAIGRA